MSVVLIRQLETLEVWFREYTKHGEPFSVQSAEAFGAGLRCALEEARTELGSKLPSQAQLQMDGVVPFPISGMSPSDNPDLPA